MRTYREIKNRLKMLEKELVNRELSGDQIEVYILSSQIKILRWTIDETVGE